MFEFKSVFTGFKETLWYFLTKKNSFKIMLMVQHQIAQNAYFLHSVALSKQSLSFMVLVFDTLIQSPVFSPCGELS